MKIIFHFCRSGRGRGETAIEVLSDEAHILQLLLRLSSKLWEGGGQQWQQLIKRAPLPVPLNSNETLVWRSVLLK